ncbi:hypothetical protein JCM10207_008138 [Rhodosporidiobolus poonsookiae]
MSWLDALPRHSIFSLPPSDSPSAPLSTHPSLAQLARPASPGAQPIFSTPSATRHSTLSQSASSKSLFGLASPGLKRSSRLASSTAAKLSTPHDAEGSVKGGRKSRMAVVRGTDIVVAVGKELRMASLADVKAKYSVDEVDETKLGEYKTLNTPAITFDIQQLVLNSTGKLLAVIGAHSVVVVVLPRKGWVNSVGKLLECRAHPVGKFYHALPGSPLVAQALWHPWGEHASSLLILTADATLREYTISEDVEEPAQTVSLARKPANGGRGGFSAEDRDASRAVGMCVGEGTADWGPLTLYALMRNGDVVSLCPFLPKKAAVPQTYIHALSAFVSAKVDYLAAAEAASSALTPFDPSASTASSILATPSKALVSSHVAASPSTPSRSRPPPALSKRYNLQLQYVNSLVRQATTSSRTPSTPSADHPSLDADLDADEDRPVRIIAPSRADFTPALQGPFLLQPAPAELDNGADSRACDIAYVHYTPEAAQAGEGQGIGVVAVAYADGKVDLCIEVEKVEARWAAEEERSSLALARPRRGGYGLDDDEDEDDSADDEDALPTLAVYETIDLGLADELSAQGGEKGEAAVARGLADNHPTLVRDPLYPDTLYVHHALGAHCLLLAPWLADLAAVAAEGEGEGEDDEAKLQREVEKTLKAQAGTEVLWVLKTLSGASALSGEDGEEQQGPLPVVGLQVVNDVYLGYSLLLLTSSLQLVAIELSLRIDPSSSGLTLPASSSLPASTGLNDSPAYVSLLDTPFSVPALLARPRAGGVSALPRLAPPPGGSKELSITPDTLRQFGKHVSTVQTSVRELVEAADAVQHRLELQMKELARQLGKLAELKQLQGDLGRSTSAASPGSAEARLRGVEARQRELVERTDRVLQKLMEAHQPEVSAYERKWFDELGRLERQVSGAGGDDDGASLEVRARRVEAQFEALRPALEDLRRKEGGPAGTPLKRGALGQAQLKQLEGKLADEAKLLSDAKRKVERLTSNLAATSLSG